MSTTKIVRIDIATISNNIQDNEYMLLLAKYLPRVAYMVYMYTVSTYAQLAAYASVYTDTIYIVTDIYDTMPMHIRHSIVLHEQGHIADYKNKGMILFTIMTILTCIPKLLLMGSQTNITTIEQQNEFYDKYYNLYMEKQANKYAGLTAKDFHLKYSDIYTKEMINDIYINGIID